MFSSEGIRKIRGHRRIRAELVRFLDKRAARVNADRFKLIM
jgi:hypothetical protein